MGCCKKRKVKRRKAASSLAPSDKYHKNPQGGHRHSTGAESSEAIHSNNNTTSSALNGSGGNNVQFSHNGTFSPPSSSSAAHHHLQQASQYSDEIEDDTLLNEEEQLLHHQLIIQGSLTNHTSQSQSAYQYYPTSSNSHHFYPTSSVGSSESITLSSQQQQQQQLHFQQPPYLVYKSNHSSSGNGSHSIIDGSTNGSVVEGSNNKYYYYYNGQYYPTTAPATTEEGVSDQVFTITASTTGKEIIMGRVGEEVHHLTGSPASGGAMSGGSSSVGLFKSKSGSIPHGSPQTRRGFRDTFINSMSPANNSHHAHSAESSPLHRSASATTATAQAEAKLNGKLSEKELGGNNKKWSFGGLFRRNKQKSSSSSAVVGAHPSAQTNNNSIVFENGGASSANNSNCNSPAKIVNNNYGSSSPIIIRPTTTTGGPYYNQRTSYSIGNSPARPASSVGFISADPSGRNSGLGHSEINRRSTASVSVTSTPKFVNAESQTRAKGKLSESDISTCDSDFELAIETHQLHENPPEPAPQENSSKGNENSSGGGGSAYKQNFLVRRLSRRKEKAAAKKAAAIAAAKQEQQQKQQSPAVAVNNTPSSNGFISSSQQNHHGTYLDHHNQLKRRVGSSPDSLNNSSEAWPSWETTKKPQTQVLQHPQQQRLLQNYSSNGSLSLSQQDGGGYTSNNSNQNTPSKSSRAAAKEAVKQRAVARRESFIQDSSSSDDDTEERSRSSLQGSFSSLNSRNKRQRAFNMQQAQFQQQRHLFPAAGGISCASPSSPMPVPVDYRNLSSNSPNLNRRLMMMGQPGSPKWDPRLIYHQDQHQHQTGADLPRSSSAQRNGTSNNLPPPNQQMSQNNGSDQSFIMATETISEDHHVVTAGLKVPFVPVQNQQQNQQCLHNGQLMYPTDEPVQYANVANGMRGRSLTPYTTTSQSTSANAAAIHHASATPPPPPPPRRDFARPTNNTTTTSSTTTITSAAPSSTNPHFYRPVSCSYLDSYEQQMRQQQQSPMMFNGNYIYPQQQQHHQALPQQNHYHQYQGQPPQHHHHQQQEQIIMNGFATHFTSAPVHNFDGGLARSSPRHFIHSTGNAYGNNNQTEVETNRHAPLIRSPSEPPSIRNARIASPAKRLISSPMSNGNTSENQLENSDCGGGDKSSSGGGKNAITSKLGFPVRRLQEASKLATSGTQSPVHLRASEFWRKKESETSTPVGGVGPGTPNKKYLNRIRSADSSPLPVPKMRKSPGGVQASNESISSLSSFSENAASPGPPKNCSSPIVPGGLKKSGIVPMKATRAQLSKTPNPQQLTYGNNNKDKENNNTQQQSAVERLKVRIPSAPDGINKISSSGGNLTTSPPRATSTSASESGNNSKTESNNPIRALIELNNGKTPGKNLEDALNELEDMYKSLRLSDEDLLDRAERRDLPTAHQELRDAPLIPIPQAYIRGSVESLGTGSGSSGTNYTGEGAPQRQRAPPTRRSIRPDTVSDDMANRRLAFPDGKPLDPRVVVAKTGSYLARSPAFSPCTSPCPPDGAHHPHHHNNLHHGFPLAFLGQEEPDLTLDDVSFRNYKKANAIRIIDPQPPFGIPLGPITAAPPNDYLHSKPSESYRPIFGHLKTPDVVNDDIAFRNLRKDLGQDASLTPKDWTPRLFSPNRDVQFNYPKVKDTKKLRAIRSLSANITHMIPPSSSSSAAAGGARHSPTSFLSQQQQQHFRDNMGKWSSYSDLHRRASAGSPARASTYLQPSWVEQIEKVQTSTETLTDHRNSSRFSTAILDPPEHWERKFPSKTVELTPPIFDPNKPRRPWTDIILESFEKEKQKEMERLQAEAEAQAAAEAENESNNKTEGKSELEENEVVAEDDDDVFMDASENSLVEQQQHYHQQNTIKISGNSSKNNDRDSMQQLEESQWQQCRPSGNVENCLNPYLQKPMPLLPGQKTRRGSWVAASSTSSQSSASHQSEQGFFPERRRKSWSDLPKDIDSFTSSTMTTPSTIMLSGSSCSASPTRKLFNPLPPPKKIRQINLEAFNNNNNNNSGSGEGNQNETATEGPHRSNSSCANGSNNHIIAESCRHQDGNNDKDGKSHMTPSSTDKVKSSSQREQEDELNELMDQLLKDAADACSESMSRAEQSSSSSSPRKDERKSISTLEEMKMDGKTSSSEQSCKQDLSCTIVGIIPKQQQSQSQPAEADRNNQQKQEHRPSFGGTTSPSSNNATAEESKSSRDNRSAAVAELEGSTSSLKVLKIVNDDSGNGKGNVVSVPKDRNTLSSSSCNKPEMMMPSSTLESSKRRNSSSRGASSIEDLIDSINESLPELEASCGGGGGGSSAGAMTTTTNSSSVSDGKPNGSSSETGSPASSIPSPSPGSPTPPVLSVSLKETNSDDCGGSSSAFPVAAKRHHLPNKQQVEESLYENLPAMMMTLPGGVGVVVGNDEKVSASSPSLFTYKNKGMGEGESSNGNIPPLISTTNEGDTRSTRREVGGLGLRRDNNNDEEDDNEEHSNSSSHQPSSLSSNDSSEVCPGSSSSPREDNMKKYQLHHHNRNHEHDQQQSTPTNKSTNTNNFKDNYNKNEEDQTSSLTSSTVTTTVTATSTTTLPFDGKSSSLSFDTFTDNQTSESCINNKNNNSQTQTQRHNHNQGNNGDEKVVVARTRSSSSSSTSSSAVGASKKEMRKKSEAGTTSNSEGGEDKKMMKKSRSTRLEKSRFASTATTTAQEITRSRRSRSCLPTLVGGSSSGRAGAILLDFLESRERRIKTVQEDGKDDHQSQGFSRSQQEVDSRGRRRRKREVNAMPKSKQANSEFSLGAGKSESCSALDELSPGERRDARLGGIWSKRARRARMFQLSAPTEYNEEETESTMSQSQSCYQRPQKHGMNLWKEKNEKWQKMIEIITGESVTTAAIPFLEEKESTSVRIAKNNSSVSFSTDDDDDDEDSKSAELINKDSYKINVEGEPAGIPDHYDSCKSANSVNDDDEEEKEEKKSTSSSASVVLAFLSEYREDDYRDLSRSVPNLNESVERKPRVEAGTTSAKVVGSLHGYSSERDDCNKPRIYSEQKNSTPSPIPFEKANGPIKPMNGAICSLGEQESCGKVGGSLTSSLNTDEKKRLQQPVAPSQSTSAVNSYFQLSTRSSQQGGTRRSSTSTTLAATQSTAAETSASETGGMSFLRNNFPFFRNSTSRSRSQSVVSDVSRSSETGDSRKEKDKSYRRKSHLNRAFTDEPVPDNNYAFDPTPKSSKPTSQEASSLENSAVEECRTTTSNSKPSVKLHPAIPSVLTCSNNKSDSNLFQGKSISRQNSNGNNNFESMPASPIPISQGSRAKDQQQNRKSTPVVKKDSFSDAEGVSFIKKMLQKESDRDRVAAAASAGKQNAQSSSSGNCNNSSSNYNIKKSPSAGNQSYWSKFSSSQSAFLRKLFDKPKVADSPISQKSTSNGKSTSCAANVPNESLTNGNSGERDKENSGEKDSSEKENAEPVLGFSVAQKASFFMKLEHEQRFSKWRKNSVDLGIISKANSASASNSLASYDAAGKGSTNGSFVGCGTNNLNEFRPRSSRHLTQPVTPTELMDIAPLVNSFCSSINSGNQSGDDHEFGSQPSHHGWNGEVDSEERLNKDNPSSDPKSFYKDYDECNKLEPLVASNLKERVSKFDEIVTHQQPLLTYSVAPPTPTMKSYSLTRSSRTNANCNNGLNNLGGFPMYHSASAIISNSSTTTSALTNKFSGCGSSSTKSSGTFYKNPCAGYSSSSSSFSEQAMSRHESAKFLPLTKSGGLSGSRRSNNHVDSPVFENGKRRGSVSDLELSEAVQQQSPLLPRGDKVKSLFVSRAPTGYHCDTTENLSEDGEFSSGGQEVAEIICRSYENSPVFRKKNWRTQKQIQANFTKEIWRRCGNYENWNQKTSCAQKKPQPQHPSSSLPQTFTATTNVIEVSTAPPPSLPTVAPSPPPSTSNLLQILTVLSSSNDELNETKPKSTKKYHHRQGGSSSRQIISSSGSDSIPPIHPGHSHNNHHNVNSTAVAMGPSDQIYVSVPHPEGEDEAFQSFFCSVKSYTQVTHYPSGVGTIPTTTSAMNGDLNGHIMQNGTGELVPTTSDEALDVDIGSIRRESDLLVMKKNVPPAKRKSNSGKYKNPLRALAARMDFRHQGYYAQPTSNSNTVQSSSDVEVTT